MLQTKVGVQCPLCSNHELTISSGDEKKSLSDRSYEVFCGHPGCSFHRWANAWFVELVIAEYSKSLLSDLDNARSELSKASAQIVKVPSNPAPHPNAA